MNAESKPIIGIFGSAVGESMQTSALAEQLGQALARYDIVLVTGAGEGIPHQVVTAAYNAGAGEIWGFTQARDLDELKKETPKIDVAIYSRFVFVPRSFPFDDIRVRRKYRNVISTATCDGGVVASGRWGTMHEFSGLYDVEKVIGVLIGSGGTADLLADNFGRINKPNKAVVIFEKDPQRLVESVLTEVKKRKAHHEHN